MCVLIFLHVPAINYENIITTKISRLMVVVHNPVIFPLPLHTHRFATDLLLWQPASPSTVEKANAKSMLFSCMDVLQPAATQEDRFQMCKSVLKEGTVCKGTCVYMCVCSSELY